MYTHTRTHTFTGICIRLLLDLQYSCHYIVLPDSYVRISVFGSDDKSNTTFVLVSVHNIPCLLGVHCVNFITKIMKFSNVDVPFILIADTGLFLGRTNCCRSPSGWWAQGTCTGYSLVST